MIAIAIDAAIEALAAIIGNVIVYAAGALLLVMTRGEA